MSEQEAGRRIPEGDPIAAELRLAVRAGDIEAIQRLLRDDPALATARLIGRGGGSGTPLHLVTDWPGYFPNGGADLEVPDGFWHAGAGGQRRAAEYLLSRGAPS
jgi:hypothetical protein